MTEKAEQRAAKFGWNEESAGKRSRRRHIYRIGNFSETGWNVFWLASQLSSVAPLFEHLFEPLDLTILTANSSVNDEDKTKEGEND